MSELPFVTIVMPIRNEADFIERTISSILENNYPVDRMEILVADGCSDDGTQDIVRRMGEIDSRIKLLENKGRIVSTGLNLALKQSHGDIFIRIDGHCEIPRDFIKKSIACLNEHPEAWVVGGYWKTVSRGYIGKVIAAATQTRFGVGNARHRLGDYDGWVDTVPYGAHHRWILEKVGYFDEELVRNQDDEFNMRIILAGGKIWLSKDISSKYYSRGCLYKLWKQYFQYGFWRIRTMQKHKRPAKLRQVIPLLFVLSLILLAVLSFVSKWFAYLLVFEAGLYLLGLAAGAVSVGLVSGLKYAVVSPMIFAILHFGYGLGGIWGFIRFIVFGGKGMGKAEDFKLSR